MAPVFPSNTGPGNGPAADRASGAIILYVHKPVCQYPSAEAIEHALYMQGWGIGPGNRSHPFTWIKTPFQLPRMLKRPSTSADSRPLKKYKQQKQLAICL
ncbi:hypothetical protein B0H13DRAFT_2322552 [Mycena leptocephala]|nr:hypothetical protein B0H13DRAFT_2322552 [Mycena leptocephala]